MILASSDGSCSVLCKKKEKPFLLLIEQWVDYWVTSHSKFFSIKGKISDWRHGSCSSVQGWKLWLEEWISTWCSWVLGGNHKLCAPNSVCQICDPSTYESFLPCHSDCRGKAGAVSFVRHAIGLLHGGGRKTVSEVDPCYAEYQSFVDKWSQLEWNLTKSTPDVRTVLSFCL